MGLTPRTVILKNYWGRQGVDARIKLTNTKNVLVCLSQPISWGDAGAHYEYYPDYPDLSRLNHG